MKVQEFITGRCARTLRLTHPKGSLPITMLLEQAQDRYQFLKAPGLEQALSDNALVTFENGRFNDHEVRRLIVADMFFACDVHGSTDVADELADDIEKWLFDGDLGYQRKDDGISAKAYASEIEFTLDSPAPKRLEELFEFGANITERVRSYGNDTPDFSFERMLFGPDPSGVQLLKTVPFAVERRATVPHKFGLWYSAAPLKTEEHVEALKQLLKIL